MQTRLVYLLFHYGPLFGNRETITTGMAEMKEVIKPEVKAKVLYSGLIKYMVFFISICDIYSDLHLQFVIAKHLSLVFGYPGRSLMDEI